MRSFVVVKDVEIENCPNCNAKLKGDGATIKCEYCGSTVERKTHALTLTRKRMLNQR